MFLIIFYVFILFLPLSIHSELTKEFLLDEISQQNQTLKILYENPQLVFTPKSDWIFVDHNKCLSEYICGSISAYQDTYKALKDEFSLIDFLNESIKNETLFISENFKKEPNTHEIRRYSFCMGRLLVFKKILMINDNK